MKHKLLFTALILLFTGCSITHITVNKNIIIIGQGNSAKQGGSNLKDNQLDQKPQTSLTVPLSP